MSALKFRPLRVTAYTVCTAAGTGCAATLNALDERRSGLTRNDFGPSPLATWIGRVPGLEAAGIARPRGPNGNAATTGWRGAGSSPTASTMRSPQRASATARHASRS